MVLASAGSPSLWAQQAARELEQVIGKLDVKFIGVQNVSEQVVRANMQLREGVPYDETTLDRDVRTLYRTGLFEFIEIKRDELSPRLVNLVVEVTPKYRVLSVSFEGNKRYKSHRLEREVKSKPNGALDERQVKQDSEKVFEYYQKAGYSQAEVNYTIERDRGSGFGRIVFRVREGDKTRIKNIVFQGNENVSNRTLRKKMEETRRWWMFSWLTGKGRLQDDKFEEDLDKIRDYYRELGYLDVDVQRNKVQFDYPSSGRMVIKIPITEGRRYKVGEVKFSGNKLFPGPMLTLVTKLRTDDWFSPSKLDKDTEAVEEFYGQGGYLDTRVRAIRKPNLTTGAIDLEYTISESERYFVESVKIEGNTKSKSLVLLRELALSPGQVFDTLRMNACKLRLENTRFFEDVNVTPEETNIPGRRNLKVKVSEARTGNLQFGAGFSSVEKAVLFVEVSQSNFDLFNYRSAFQGDGQKFRLRFQVGSQSSEVLLAFEEPWLFERALALGFQIYRTTSDYNSSFYEEMRTGGELYLRKYLVPRWALEGRLSYRYETVSIGNVDPAAPAVIRSLEGEQTLSKLGFTLLRDTRDKMINTTRGNRLELTTEMAGGPFGADVNYYRVEGRASQFIPVFEAQTQVIGLIARTGVVQNFGDSKSVPFYDRYFMGGPNDLRGYEYRDVGPKDSSGEPIGGKTYGFFSFEYSLDIVSPVRFAMFYDAGFVNAGAFDFGPANYNDNWGFGIRMFVAGAPMSLDYGIPLTSDGRNKKGNQFNFSFGTRF